MAHKLLPLPFGYDALEPYIDAETMELHHDNHHQAYVDNLNNGRDFGSFEHLRSLSTDAATNHVGSRWAFMAATSPF